MSRLCRQRDGVVAVDSFPLGRAQVRQLTVQAAGVVPALYVVEDGSAELGDELRKHVGSKLGKFTIPKFLTFTQELPKTRSGKIMRRLLRDIAEGRMLGDTTTLADSNVVHDLQQRAQAEAGKED